MGGNHFHPDEPLDRQMTQAQKDLLRRVVATNGGGISQYAENQRVISGLVLRHMIQGKAGSGSMMVHTRRGLDWVRENP